MVNAVIAVTVMIALVTIAFYAIIMIRNGMIILLPGLFLFQSSLNLFSILKFFPGEFLGFTPVQ